MKLKNKNSNKNSMDKKGASAIEVIGGMILVLIVVFLIIGIFFPKLSLFGDLFKQEQTKLSSDPDNDNIRSILDKCPCTAGEVEQKGCPKDFTEEQIKADKEKYNIDTGCGIHKPEEVSAGTTTTATPGTQAPGVEAKTSQPGSPFQNYRSIELFGDDDWGNPENAPIRQACAGMVGRECPSEDDDCNTDEFSYDLLAQGCWIMASEDDGASNNCGQAKVDDGVIISLHQFSNLNADVSNQYFSADKEEDPKHLFNWKWKSKPEHGSLLCKEGFWYGCKTNSEGRSLTANGINYFCRGSEWVRE